MHKKTLWNRIIIEKLLVFRVIKELSPLWNIIFIIVFTRTRYFAVPIQFSPQLHTIFNIHFNNIQPVMLLSGNFISCFLSTNMGGFVMYPMRATCIINHILIFLPWKHPLNSTKVIFAILLLLPTSEVEIVPSALCSQILSICVQPLEWDTKFHTHTKQRVVLQACV
jgi:hypothetical protein